MAESISRSLRDGSLEGEHAPALSIEDSLESPLGSHAFNHFLITLVAHIAAGRSQASGVVLVAFNRSPSFYSDLLRHSGFDASLVDKYVRILDCYSDPLGWKDRTLQAASDEERSVTKGFVTVLKNVKDIGSLSSSILDLGKGFSGQGKAKFAVAIGSVSDVLRHASLSSVSGLLTSLRSHDQISSIFWLIHSDLHEPRVCTAFEYISSMVANLQPMMPSTGEHRNSANLLSLEQNSCKARFHVCLKRRNGRVKLLDEVLNIEETGIKFTAIPTISATINQNLLPKVQFNLKLSEKERADRENVVLPFEHQGTGETIQIYDGRRSLSESQKESYLKKTSAMDEIKPPHSEKGEIHYIRDSDDEQPDSDEDPDDDLDI
ncbi:elongator complex protein 5 [Typha angustifolia]|uniref:elongator complex protein 5 n=1 Tax=Typha angustifolia TaxID=59011 RepID=UPI003C2E7AE4